MAPMGVGEGATGSFPDPTCKPASEFTRFERHSARSCLLGRFFLLSGVGEIQLHSQQAKSRSLLNLVRCVSLSF